jgi:CelD/BcsL family acetyltransferase involved in cellulose biosynthesis
MKGQEVRIINSAEDLSALGAEWNDLVLRCPGYSLSQTFQWSQTAWETIGRVRGYELNCLALRSDGRLVAVWPLAIHRKGGVRTIRPLGWEGEDYCAPLVEPGGEAESRTALLWRTVTRSADLAILRHVRADSPLAGVLQAGRHWRITEGGTPAPYVARDDYPDWAAYHATISSQFRYQIRRRRRKLAEAGRIVLERESTAGCAALIDWMIEQKKRWLVRSELTNDWLFQLDARNFLVGLATQEDATGNVALFSLKVDGVPTAAYFVTVDRRRVEYYFTAYDPQWSPYSPGAILIEYLLQWAFERGLDFDFRIGGQPYKYKWAKRSCDTINWHVATTRRGIPALVHLRAVLFISHMRQRLALGRFLPPKLRDRLKELLPRGAV